MKLQWNMLLFFLFSVVFTTGAQEQLVGAKDLLKSISDHYRETVKDFEATVKWSQDNEVQEGRLWFKNPQKLRIDFDTPKGQVLCSNGYEFWVYIDTMNVTLHQEILQKEKKREGDGKMVTVDPAILTVPVGYDRFLKEYAIEYVDAKNLMDYDDGSGNISKVYKLKLIRWRSSQNGFNMVYLTIQPDGLIRKVEGITAAYKKIVFELNGYKINQGIPDLKFEYEPPAHANTVKNFISKQGDS